MKKLAIIGSGDLAEQLARLADDSGQYSVVGFFDDYALAGSTRHERKVLGNFTSINSLYSDKNFDELIIGVGYKHMAKREALYNTFKGKIPFAKLIHRSAIVHSTCTVGEGSVLYSGCVVDMQSHIRENVLLYTGCIISHDVIIGCHSMLSPGVTTSGFVKIGEKVNLGTGTLIKDNIEIVDNVQTGVGSVVVKNILEQGLYLGVPAKLIRLK